MTSVRRGWLGVVAALTAACASAPEPDTGPSPRPAPRGPSAGGAPDAAAPPAPGPGAVLYRAGAIRPFAIERRDSLTLQLPGGATQVQEFRRTAYVAVAIRGAAAPYEVTIQLDSVRQEGGLIPPDSLYRAEGTRWTATLGADGRLGELTADRASTVGDQIGATLPTLFPALPPTGLEPGAEWSDTTQRRLKADAFDAVERAVTQYRSVPASGPAIGIESLTLFQRTGTGGQSAQPMEMTAGGSRRGSYRFAREGTVLEAYGSDSSEIKISIPAVGQTVPVSQRGTWRVDQLGD